MRLTQTSPCYTPDRSATKPARYWLMVVIYRCKSDWTRSKPKFKLARLLAGSRRVHPARGHSKASASQHCVAPNRYPCQLSRPLGYGGVSGSSNTKRVLSSEILILRPDTISREYR